MIVEIESLHECFALYRFQAIKAEIHTGDGQTHGRNPSFTRLVQNNENGSRRMDYRDCPALQMKVERPYRSWKRSQELSECQSHLT